MRRAASTVEERLSVRLRYVGQFMPWHVGDEGEGDCEGENPFPVINDESGETEGCHPSREDAEAQVRALYAEEEDGGEQNANRAPGQFRSTLVVEGGETGDRRAIDENALTWNEDLPLPMMFMRETPQGGLGGNPHGGARLGAQITEVRRDGLAIRAVGVFDTSDDGREFDRLVETRMLRGVSVDLDSVRADVEWDEEDDEADPLLRVHGGRIRGATASPFPAFVEATIEWVPPGEDPWAYEAPAETAASISVREGVEVTAGVGLALVAGATPIDLLPLETWFDDPEFGENALADSRLVEQVDSRGRPTGIYGCPLTLIDDARMFGHVGLWGTCHRGSPFGPNVCVEPFHSENDYANYHLHGTPARCDCEDNDGRVVVATGTITLGTGHADLSLAHTEAMAHYENTGRAVADVVAGEDAHGVWVAGAVRPGISHADRIALHGATLSGDWRWIGAGRELVASLAVNVPGFPVQRRARAHIEGDRQTALVAAGMVTTGRGGAYLGGPDRRIEALEARLRRLESIAEPLRPLAAEAIVASVGPPR